MAAITATNLAAIQAYRGLANATDFFSLASRRLSSGLRVEQASDGPADLAKSLRHGARLRSLERLEIDMQESRSLVQTAESGIETIIKHLQSIRELAVTASSSSTVTPDRNSLQNQYESLRDEITSIANTTFFNGLSLLNGTYDTSSSTLIFQVGADSGNRITLNINTVTAAALGVNNLSLGSVGLATNALTAIDSAINLANAELATVGTSDKRLSAGIDLVEAFQDTHRDAISALIDADLPRETVNFAKGQILLQAASAALAQANLFPQNVLASILPGKA